MLLAILSLVLAPVLALIVYGFHPIQRWRYRHIPGPKPRWLIGNLLDIHREGQENAAARWAREYGPVWCFWMGAWPVVMTDDPELARKVLAKPARHKIWCLHRGKEKDYEDHTLFFANGERWRASRAAWQPFFSRPSMQVHSVRMAQSAGRLCSLLEGAAASGAEVDMWRSMGQLTMDVVGTTVFGVTFDTLSRPDEPDGQEQEQAHPGPFGGAAAGGVGGSSEGGGLSKLGGTSASRLLWAVRTVFEVCGPANPYFALCFLFPELEGFFRWLVNTCPNRTFRRELAARRVVLDVGAELLQLSKQAPASGGGKGADVAGGTQGGGTSSVPGSGGSKVPSAVDPGSFLAVVGRSTGKWVQDGSSRVLLDDQWATNQSTTFLTAGYETTANNLAFTIYCLATNPDKEAKLLAEIDAFGRGRTPTAEDVQASLPYALAVVRESLRVFPPSVTALRETAGPWQLGDYKLPASTAMQVSIYSMHRNPRYWREPLAFKPERFLPGTPEAEEATPGAFIPFGSGSRECVGARFSEMEAVISLVCLYQQYVFRLLPGQVPLKTKTLITHGPVGGVRCTVHRRD
ncbi:hypothetical protein ABPG77_006276 [Micractinium sp. CCAP 211/92]